MTTERDSTRIIAALRQASLFRDVEETHLGAVAWLAVEVEPPAGTTIMQRGEHAEYLWVVVDGMMELEAATIPGSRRVGTPGVTYGVPALVPPYQYTSTVRTGTATRLLRLPAAQLIALCEANPSFGFRLMRVALEETQARIWEIIARAEGHLTGDYIT